MFFKRSHNQNETFPKRYTACDLEPSISPVLKTLDTNLILDERF